MKRVAYKIVIVLKGEIPYEVDSVADLWSGNCRAREHEICSKDPECIAEGFWEHDITSWELFGVPPGLSSPLIRVMHPNKSLLNGASHGWVSHNRSIARSRFLASYINYRTDLWSPGSSRAFVKLVALWPEPYFVCLRIALARMISIIDQHGRPMLGSEIETVASSEMLRICPGWALPSTAKGIATER